MYYGMHDLSTVVNYSTHVLGMQPIGDMLSN